MRTIAIVNQKGGCGKTTTAINLAAVYAARGQRTLLIDMDPQAHCAAGLGVPEDQIEYSVAEGLLADLDGGLDVSSLVWEVSRNLFLAPSTVRLAALEAPGGGMHRLPDKDRRLEKLLKHLDDRFDCCLVDCPPTIGLLTFNALRAAREALIPVETGFFAMKGAARQWNTIQRTIQHIGRPIACHLLPTMHKPELGMAQDILGSLRRDFAGQIVPVVIREHDLLREAAGFGQPIVEYAPDSEAHRDFERLADWLDDHRCDGTVDIEIIPEPLGRPARPGHVPRSRPAAPPLDDPGSRAAELAARVRRDAEHALDSEPRSGRDDREARTKPVRVDPAAEGPLITAPEARSIAAAAPPSPAPSRPEPGTVRPLVEEISGETASAPAEASTRTNHLWGVRPTSQGVLFVQPGPGGQRISIAGDFNGWSAEAHPLRYNTPLGIYQAIVSVPPGEHQYRLVIDGRWQADPYNPVQRRNAYGEPNSVLTVLPPGEST